MSCIWRYGDCSTLFVIQPGIESMEKDTSSETQHQDPAASISCMLGAKMLEG